MREDREERGGVWDEKEEWTECENKITVLTDSRIKLSFKDEVVCYLKVFDVVSISPNLRIV